MCWIQTSPAASPSLSRRPGRRPGWPRHHRTLAFAAAGKARARSKPAQLAFRYNWHIARSKPARKPRNSVCTIYTASTPPLSDLDTCIHATLRAAHLHSSTPSSRARIGPWSMVAVAGSADSTPHPSPHSSRNTSVFVGPALLPDYPAPAVPVPDAKPYPATLVANLATILRAHATTYSSMRPQERARKNRDRGHRVHRSHPPSRPAKTPSALAQGARQHARATVRKRDAPIMAVKRRGATGAAWAPAARARSAPAASQR